MRSARCVPTPFRGPGSRAQKLAGARRCPLTHTFWAPRGCETRHLPSRGLGRLPGCGKLSRANKAICHP